MPSLLSLASPVGVFDSGVGGLSVLTAIRAQLPNESLLYVADSANAPYGDRDSAFILGRAFELTEYLCKANAKVIVVACNTATVVAVEALRSAFDIPIVAMEPAIKPAVARTRTGVIAVLATSRTLESESVARLCRLHGGNVRVLLQPCPGLVEQVERGELDSEKTMHLLRSYVLPVCAAGADTLVLGCTHYPFLAPQIRAIAGSSVMILDSAQAIANEVERRISSAQVATPPLGPKEIFFTTGEPGPAQALFSKLWGTRVEVQLLP